MFLPAFVLALFVYGLWDVWQSKKSVQFSWEYIRGERVLSFTFSPPFRDFVFFRVVFELPSKSTPLPPLQGGLKGNGTPLTRGAQKGFLILTPETTSNRFFLPAETGKVWISIQGRLDIFRILVPLLPLSFRAEAKKGNREDGDLYFRIRPFVPEDSLHRIDALQTARRGKLMVKEREVQKRGNDNPDSTGEPFFAWKGNADMARRRDIEQGELGEWGMIFLGSIAAFLEWGNIPFLILSFASMALYFFCRAKKILPFGGRKSLNFFGLLLFAVTISEGMLLRDTVASGVHFLLFLSVGKHFFERERRDGFTHIFLILFVFVALSLFTLRVWFLPFFLVYLLFSVFLFSLYAGGEKPEEYTQSIGRAKTRKSFWTMAFSVLVLTLLFFLILPHGNKAQDSSILGQKEVQQTGFTEEVSLHDVQGIKENFAKAIVIENAKKEEQDSYKEWYWRGARFDHFTGSVWKRMENLQKNIPYPMAVRQKGGTEYRIKLYPEGGTTIFLPASPLKIESGTDSLVLSGLDRTTAGFEKPQFSAKTISLFLQKAPNGLPEDFSPSVPKSFRIPPVDRETETLLTPFWEKIPQEIQQNPNAIRKYIQDDAGFSYSLDAPAKNLQDFVYGSHQGHCEYFATLLALTLQHFEYPAVLVNGFMGGEWNDEAGAWIVRGKNAHSWVEILEDGKWEILDATPLVPAESEKFWFEKVDLFQTVIKYYDTVELKWYEYIVSFTGDRQKAFFRTLWAEKTWGFFLLLLGGMLWGIHQAWRRWKILQNTSHADRFLLWLKKRYEMASFPLAALEWRYPKLVQKIRRLLYGKSSGVKNLLDLKKMWEEKR